MLHTRRALVALSVVLLLLAIGAGVASRPQPQVETGSGAGPVAQQEAREPLLERTLRIGAARSQPVRAQVGRLTQLTVTGADQADVVEIRGLDQFAQISPDGPAVFSLLPTRAGNYPLMLVGTGERIGALRVSG